MREVKLKNLDRLLLLPILLKSEGNILVVKQARSMVDTVSFTEEEKTELEIVQVKGGGVSWKPEKDKEISVTLSIGLYEIIKEHINQRCSGNIDMQFLSFVEKILKKEDMEILVKKLEEEAKKLEEKNKEKAEVKP